jgi:hypothetical protein
MFGAKKKKNLPAAPPPRTQAVDADDGDYSSRAAMMYKAR